MRNEPLSTVAKVLLGALALAGLMTRVAAAQETIVYSFPANSLYGWSPNGGLVVDAAGNLYGTTSYGGSTECTNGCGSVFELTPKSRGGWTEKVVHRFSSNGKDGSDPIAGPAIDSTGNLYGTTLAGGLDSLGIGFGLTPNGSGGWPEKILYNFKGNDPQPQGLIVDAVGNLYGMAYQGGAHNYGYVFEISPKTGGGWMEKILYSFIGTDGSQSPRSNLIFDSAGNLYGTTYGGGPNPYGDVFELSPATGGSWTEKVLYRFQYSFTDGYRPEGGLIFDAAGNLYSTTTSGGSYQNGGYGTVFKLSPVAGGGWTEAVLYSFSSNGIQGKDGVAPIGPLIFDSAGNLYGTTALGGAYAYGTVFKLSPSTGGGWTETILHNFNFDGKDGIGPNGGLTFVGGNLYGTTLAGGANNAGTVFEIAP